MTNKEKYDNIFHEVFNVEINTLGNSFTKETIESWDSVHQLNIVALMEENFDIMLDPEDIMDMTSYEKGIEILKKNDITL